MDRFARFQKGETLETLLAEAAAAKATAVVDPKTIRSAVGKK
jgi:hypothetical protein